MTRQGSELWGEGASQTSWLSKDFLDCGLTYDSILRFLMADDDGSLMRIVGESIDATEQDLYAAVMVELCQYEEKGFSVLMNLLKYEIEGIEQVLKGSALRGNSFCTRFETAFVKNIGTNYLRKMLEPLVRNVVNDHTLFLEVDPTKCGDQERILEKNRKLLKEQVSLFLDRILDRNLLMEMPREIRAIADQIDRETRSHLGEDSNNIIAGFLMLRYISTGIVIPESWKIVPGVATASGRRNLVLIAKILQTIANSKMALKVNNKEDYMSHFSEFVSEARINMLKYFQEVCTDPFQQPGGEKWVDLNETKPRKSLEEVKQKLDLQMMFTLHRLLYTYKDRIANALEASSRSRTISSRTKRTIAEFLPTLNSLCASPEIARKKGALTRAAELETIRVSGNDSDSQLLTIMKETKFLYQGPADKMGRPVFYVIADRLRPEFVEGEGGLMLTTFIESIMGTVVGNGPYSIVADVSRVSIQTWKSHLHSTLPAVISSFGRSYRKNVADIWIVHPGILSSAIVNFACTFASSKMKKKIRSIYDWRELSKFIDSSSIMLPDSSREFITKYHQVIKVNSKGKRQNRIIKFTSNSILNIDEKSRKIQNEKALSAIEAIFCPKDSTELVLQFNASEYTQKKRTMFSKLEITSKPFEDMAIRRYLFDDQQDRADVLEDIFMSAYRHNLRSPLTEDFKVVKINKAGKRQDRVFKFTVDSLLNLDDTGKIHSEFSLGGIEGFGEDNFDPNGVCFKIKSEGVMRRIVCKEKRRFLDKFRDAMNNYKGDELREEFLKIV